ncbi:MAG: hypothetical protein LBP38_09150 [Desulfovibrio sp.]|jgi:hypothetical protein|nr:hypothetical protein [Desulfovibrio sp.]
MRPKGRPGELFAAFSRINARAFKDDRLVSCPVLSKSPDNGDVLRHFLASGPRRPRSPFFLFRTALRYAAANVGHLLFMLCAALFIRLLRFPIPAALRTRTGNRSADVAANGAGELPIPANPQVCAEPRKDEAGNGAGELLILDTFAVLPSLAREGTYRELYLVGLEEAARASGREVVILFRLYGSRNPRVLWKALRVLARKGNALTEVHLLTCADWALLLPHMLLYPVSLARLVRSLRKPEAALNADPATSLPVRSPEECIRNALLDCAGQCALIGESRRLAARRLAFRLSPATPAGSERPPRNTAQYGAQSPDAAQATGKRYLPRNPPGISGQGPVADKEQASSRANPPGVSGQDPKFPAAPARPARVISWYENQTVNKAFQRGLAQAEKEGAPHIRVTGAQLFIWPDNLLNNHADDVEADLGLVPDEVLVSGPYFLPEQSRQRYAVGPALRCGDIFRSAARPAGAVNRRPGSPRPSPVLVLLSYHPGETRRVLRLLRPAAAETPENFAYRFHPATRIEDFAGLLPPGARIADGSLREALDSAGAVIGAGSGALAEAAAAGIPVLAVEDPSGIAGLGLNYLPPCGKGELWESVRAPEEIAPALAGLYARLGDPERPAKVRAFRDLLFCEPTPERIRESFSLD